ncbi:hypothetical protein EHW67_18865 [Arenibacter aquaticus]|uniref:Uncharacterized protein n=1 Tax=Arenibacter aquaticus TaxID=2489054 RepID=A0A3S0AX02_9FLAO|nr:hypothetical protein [Arenibacter aquaticus]RTE52247.1 hypothetical protein EHW67_18865 [Arenibacter aquaticus]
MNSVKKYLLIQRTYAEDEDDVEHYYIESSESYMDFKPNEKMIMSINQDRLETKCNGEQVIIGLNLKKQEFENLLRILETKFNERVTIRRL